MGGVGVLALKDYRRRGGESSKRICYFQTFMQFFVDRVFGC